MPRKIPETSFTFRVPVGLLEVFQSRCNEYDLTASQVLRRYMRAFIIDPESLPLDPKGDER